MCGSESFAYISRWIPAPERRARPRPTVNEATMVGESVKRKADSDVDAYRQLLAPTQAHSNRTRWLTGGAFGLLALGVARWMWGRPTPREISTDEGPTSSSTAPE
jgi:hypothetical protein